MWMDTWFHYQTWKPPDDMTRTFTAPSSCLFNSPETTNCCFCISVSVQIKPTSYDVLISELQRCWIVCYFHFGQSKLLSKHLPLTYFSPEERKTDETAIILPRCCLGVKSTFIYLGCKTPTCILTANNIRSLS